MRLFTAIPCFGGKIESRTTEALIRLHHYCINQNIPVNHNFLNNSAIITEARNELVSMFLDSDSTHFLFIDADIEFPLSAFKRAVRANKDVFCVPYPSKKFHWKYYKPEKGESSAYWFQMMFDTTKEFSLNDGAIEIDRAPTGFMMIKREVFEIMKKKMPELKYKMARSMNGEMIEKELWGFFDLGKTPEGGRVGEDYAFCDRWKACGGRIFASVLDKMAHIGNHSYEGAAIDKFDVERNEKS
jgi:hypothetical protein